MKRITVPALAAALTLAAAVSTSAQRQQTVQTQAPSSSARANTPKPPPAPASVKAKYEGGMVGYKKADGTLNFDDANSRLVFRDKQGRELFPLAYNALLMAWPDTKKSTSTAGKIANNAPYAFGLPGLLMKNKSRYLTLRYRDPDTGTEGVTSFKINDKEMLASVIDTLADKAGLAPRGDGYVRRKDAPTTTGSTQPGSPD